MKVQAFAFLAVLAMPALAARQTVSTDTVDAAFDLRADAVRVIATTDEILQVAILTADPSTLVCNAMMGEDPADPTTWVQGKEMARYATNAETTIDWKPNRHGLFRLAYDNGSDTLYAYYDCRETAGLPDGSPIDGFPITPTVSAAPAASDGAKVKVTLADPQAGELVEGEAYVLVYSNNFNIGTATVTAKGFGDYAGEVSATYEVVSQTPVLMAEDQLVAMFDTRTGALVYVNRGQIPQFARNNTETFAEGCQWKQGGETSATKLARVSFAAVGSADAEAPDASAFTTLVEGDGECAWQEKFSKMSGWYDFRFEIVTGGVVGDKSFTRRLYVPAKGFVLLLF